MLVARRDVEVITVEVVVVVKVVVSVAVCEHTTQRRVGLSGVVDTHLKVRRSDRGGVPGIKYLSLLQQ